MVTSELFLNSWHLCLDFSRTRNNNVSNYLKIPQDSKLSILTNFSLPETQIRKLLLEGSSCLWLLVLVLVSPSKVIFLATVRVMVTPELTPSTLPPAGAQWQSCRTAALGVSPSSLLLLLGKGFP